MKWFGRDEPLAPPPPSRPDPETSLAGIEAQLTAAVPQIVAARVQRIISTLRDILPRLANLGPGSEQAYNVVATATSYLPEALGAYLRLPARFADHRPVSNGKTSLAVLCDQLDLLGSKMDEVFDAVCRADADALVVHGRFLSEKFGTGSLDVGSLANSSAPSPAPAPAPAIDPFALPDPSAPTPASATPSSPAPAAPTPGQ